MTVLISLLKFPPDFTGAGFCTEWLYRKLKLKGVKRIYVLTTSVAYPTGVERRSGITVIRISKNPFIDSQKSRMKVFKKTIFVLSSVWRAIGVFRRLSKKVDMVHTVDSSWLSTVVAWCAFFAKKPQIREIVLLGHDDPLTLQKKPFFLRGLFLKPLHDAKLIIAVSPPLMKACVDYGLPADKIWCRPNTVYFEEAVAAPKPIDVDFGLPTVLWVGKIGARKNVDFLLKTAQYLQTPAQLLFVGPCEDEGYMALLLRLAKEAETKTKVRVRFLGRVDHRLQLQEIYSMSSLFWFASHKEGLGNVVIEALLNGTPVVTLPVDGIMSYVLEGPGDGEIMDTQDPRQFAEGVDRCLKRGAFDRGDIMQRAKRRFDPDRIEDEYIQRFKKILA